MTATRRHRPHPTAPDQPPPLVLELAHRWPELRPGALAGAASVVAGGLVAAVARPLDLDAGSWAAAFLVLVGGVAQLAVTTTATALLDPPPTSATRWRWFALWNGAVVATIAGTVAELPLLTTVATGALAVVLADVWRALGDAPWRRRAATRAVRAVLALLALSLPVGLALAWLRHG